MMKAIAEFAMRSQPHAIGVSMTAAVLPLLGWLSMVIVALVCLRQGMAVGSLVMLWTLLPVGATLYFFGDPSTAIALTGAFLMALLLRQVRSWEPVLVASVVLSGLGVLVSLSKKIREAEGELRLSSLNMDLQTLFELTKLDTLFQICDTLEEALASL